MCWVLWERLPAAIVIVRGWKPLPQVVSLATWAYRISALHFYINLKRLTFPGRNQEKQKIKDLNVSAFDHALLLESAKSFVSARQWIS